MNTDRKDEVSSVVTGVDRWMEIASPAGVRRVARLARVPSRQSCLQGRQSWRPFRDCSVWRASKKCRDDSRHSGQDCPDGARASRARWRSLAGPLHRPRFHCFSSALFPSPLPRPPSPVWRDAASGDSRFYRDRRSAAARPGMPDLAPAFSITRWKRAAARPTPRMRTRRVDGRFWTQWRWNWRVRARPGHRSRRR